MTGLRIAPPRAGRRAPCLRPDRGRCVWCPLPPARSPGSGALRRARGLLLGVTDRGPPLPRTGRGARGGRQFRWASRRLSLQLRGQGPGAGARGGPFRVDVPVPGRPDRGDAEHPCPRADRAERAGAERERRPGLRPLEVPRNRHRAAPCGGTGLPLRGADPATEWLASCEVAPTPRDSSRPARTSRATTWPERRRTIPSGRPTCPASAVGDWSGSVSEGGAGRAAVVAQLHAQPGEVARRTPSAPERRESHRGRSGREPTAARDPPASPPWRRRLLVPGADLLHVQLDAGVIVR
jgi:hypothetical protein